MSEPTFMSVWLVLEPADATTIAVFDNEADAHRLALRLTAERGYPTHYGVDEERVYDQLPDDWKERWKWA
jgi:L-ascorbate metabolism protein UlaG (beta-lactamase superfamily)